MSTSYLTLTNDAIQESGADLAEFMEDGSDWDTTTDSLRLKFKKWVARAWKEIQQDSFDLSFMEEQAVVNVDPGVHFYTDGTAVTALDTLENTDVDVYDQDATVAINAIPFGTIYDLTGVATNTKPFGYFNVVTTADTPISWALKPGAEYFGVTSSASFDTFLNFFPQTRTNTVSNYEGVTLPVLAKITTNGHTYTIGFDNIDTIYAHTANAAALETDLTTDTTVSIASYLDPTLIYYSTDYVTGIVDGPFIVSPAADVSVDTKGYIHSWKSFDFSEETNIDDFQENIKEIDQKSFRIINYFQAPPQGEVPMDFVPWEVFSPIYDLSNSPPGIPRIITRDNLNRFRLYPHPYQKMTLKFDYIRTPQILVDFDDVPKGIADDITDMIMWAAVRMYGEYDEQPSVIARANKNYKNYQLRFDQMYRPKFHFRPHRLW